MHAYREEPRFEFTSCASMKEEIERVALRKISSEKFFINRRDRLQFIVARDIRQRYSYGVI